MTRYNRQELISGWKQKNLRDYSVAVIGSDLLAGCTSILLTSLGIGTLEIYDNSIANVYEKNLFFEVEENEPRVEAMERMLRKINGSVEINGVNCLPDRDSLMDILGRPKMIIELTNNPDSKKACISYGRRMSIPVVTGSAGCYSGKFSFPASSAAKDTQLQEYSGRIQGIVPSQVLSGMIVENLRKYVMPLHQGEHPISFMGYSLLSGDRFTENPFAILPDRPCSDMNLSGKRVQIIGSGALGNVVGPGLALLGVGRLDIIDADNIEETNLNRQPFFYNSVGGMKAEVLGKRVNKIYTDMSVRSIARFLDESFEPYYKSNRLDLMVDCVDNLAARAVINHYAIEHRIPLISGGTGPDSGQVLTYLPSETACLDCRMGVDKAMVEEISRHSCIRDPMPSVIMSNEVVGGLMTGESLAALRPDLFREKMTGVIRYDSTKPRWAGVVTKGGGCPCSRGDVKSWMAEVMRKYGT